MKAIPFLLAAACTGSATEYALDGNWTIAAFAYAIAVLLILDATKERP
ncbi:hypothetical protein [Streptomyces sp. SID5910]|nr:hypothetical protein [Streptomyces sp. SID5910]MYR46618.1 hypothetical protein [Streptomyces sp. SID5910]